MIYLEYRDGSSEKFWKLELSGSTFTVTFGKIGVAGQSQTKVFESAEKARKEADKLAAAKRKKGYADTLPPSDTLTPEKPPKIRAVTAAAPPAEGPESVVDDGKPKAWHSEESAFDLARLADPNAFSDEWDEDDEDEDEEAADSEDTQNHLDDPTEERFRCACKARNLQLMQNLWKLAVDVGENDRNWLSEGLAICLMSGYEAMDAPLVQWLLEQGASFPGSDDNDDEWDDDDEIMLDDNDKIPRDFYPQSGPFRSHNPFANYFYREYMKKRDPVRVKEIYETLMDAACTHLVRQLEQLVPQYRSFVPEEGRKNRNFKGFDGLPGRTPLDRSFLGIEKDIDLPEEFWCFCLEALRARPTAAHAHLVWKQYLDEAFSDAAEVFAARMREYAACIRTGVEESKKKGFDYLPEGGRIGKEFIGLELAVPNEYWVYVYLRGAERENPFDFKTERISGLTTQYMPRYAHLFGQEMEKLVKEGVFDGLFEWGGFLLKMEDSPEVIGTYVTNPGASERAQERLAELENMAERCRGGHLSGQTLAQETGDGFCIFLALLHGLFGPADEERAYRLLRSFLYLCADGKDEDRIVSMMYHWEDSYPHINYELAVFHKENLHPDRAEKYVRRAINMGCTYAVELEQELKTEAELRRRLAREILSSALGEALPAVGFDRQAAAREWRETTFEQAFSEEDLYLVTENIVARARPNGYIYIRFLVECEAGYAEALDFVNRLLERGYVRLSRRDKEPGFALRVRFLIKPEYIPQMRNTKSKLGIEFPQSSCHAFFARAVRYPALRQKVVDYAERALNRFDVYLDLWEDNATVPGTFAVIALAFCGKEYLPLVSRYAGATDDEHTYLLPALMLPLVRHYGDDPELAGAVFDIARYSNADGVFRLPKELIWSADFMERFLEHGGAAEGDTHALEDFAIACERIYGDNARSNLKKLRGLATVSTARRERQIYADFFNAYLTAMCTWDSDNLRVSFEPIDPVDEDSGEHKEVVLERQECVIPLAEAEKRGYEISEDTDEQLVLFLSPACILDDETIAYVRQQLSNIGRENSKPERERSCRVLMSNGSCCIRCGSWVLNTTDMPFECGVLLYDGKKNSRPMILFGELDALALGVACKKRWPKSPEDAEVLRRKYLIRESAPRRTDAAWMAADRFFEEDDRSGHFYSEWHSCMARRTLERITPPFGEIIYLCARLMLIYLIERRGDAVTLAELAEELTILQPERVDHWQSKLERARSALAE